MTRRYDTWQILNEIQDVHEIHPDFHSITDCNRFESLNFISWHHQYSIPEYILDGALIDRDIKPHHDSLFSTSNAIGFESFPKVIVYELPTAQPPSNLSSKSRNEILNTRVDALRNGKTFFSRSFPGTGEISSVK
ncbi:hypothetical protein NPIL_579061 [Nephila pilipes]|uniref:Uncharacterized protein n=1 Tax=Nephila pilipes TaxID=299642 RepID=A0A8X6NCA7_NEPPI|nr:hypothetical protein NPIL_579061 [Nephila pilipes]